jgi:hypothetical protein
MLLPTQCLKLWTKSYRRFQPLHTVLPRKASPILCGQLQNSMHNQPVSSIPMFMTIFCNRIHFSETLKIIKISGFRRFAADYQKAFHSLLEASVSTLSSFTPQGLANTIWAISALFAASSVSSTSSPSKTVQQTFAKLVQATLSQNILPNLQSQDIASILWAIAQMADKCDIWCSDSSFGSNKKRKIVVNGSVQHVTVSKPTTSIERLKPLLQRALDIHTDMGWKEIGYIDAALRRLTALVARRHRTKKTTSPSGKENHFATDIAKTLLDRLEPIADKVVRWALHLCISEKSRKIFQFRSFLFFLLFF